MAIRSQYLSINSISYSLGLSLSLQPPLYSLNIFFTRKDGITLTRIVLFVPNLDGKLNLPLFLLAIS